MSDSYNSESAYILEKIKRKTYSWTKIDNTRANLSALTITFARRLSPSNSYSRHIIFRTLYSFQVSSLQFCWSYHAFKKFKLSQQWPILDEGQSTTSNHIPAGILFSIPYPLCVVFQVSNHIAHRRILTCSHTNIYATLVYISLLPLCIHLYW